MDKCIDVTIDAAMRIADEFNKDQVIIIAWDGKHKCMHCTTYGKSLYDSAVAAVGGNKLKQFLGFPAQYCQVLPDRVLEALKALDEANSKTSQ
jgi:hypothetical protein